MAVGKIPEGYDGTAGRAKTTASRKVSISRLCIWTVTRLASCWQCKYTR